MTEEKQPIQDRAVRREFEMSDTDLSAFKAACSPPQYVNQNWPPQVNPATLSRDFWKRLGQGMDFKWWTVKPSLKGEKFFTAVIYNEDEERPWEKTSIT